MPCRSSSDANVLIRSTTLWRMTVRLHLRCGWPACCHSTAVHTAANVGLAMRLAMHAEAQKLGPGFLMHSRAATHALRRTSRA